jgi:hypothetical protein
VRFLCLLALAVPSTVIAAEPPAAEDEPLPETAEVHLGAAPEVELLRALSVDRRVRATPTHVCTAPCDLAVELRPDALFFVDGPNIPRSGPFTLDAAAPTQLLVDPGSLAQRYAGITVLTLGAVGSVIGSTVLTLDLFDEASSSARLGAGGITLGTGLASLVVGIALVATSGTEVEVVRAATSDPLRFEF